MLFSHVSIFMQVMDVVDRLFVAIFDSINASCQKELKAIGNQYPFEPLKVIFLTYNLEVVAVALNSEQKQLLCM